MKRVTLHQDVAAFSNGVLPLLMHREAANCLMIGLLDSLAKDPHTYSDQSPVMLELRDASLVVGAALMTPPYSLILTRLSPGALDTLVAFLVAEDIPVPGVLAPSETAQQFARLYARNTSAKPRTKFEQRIYQLERVSPRPLPPGRLRPAEPNDAPLLTGWGRDFAVDARLSEHEVIQAPERIERLLDAGGLFVWEHAGKARSMASCSGHTPNGIRVSYVFTPRVFRGQGYATAITATLSQRLLDEGKRFCFLFTDISNPSSNSIYQKIGYQPVEDVHMLVWEPSNT